MDQISILSGLGSDITDESTSLVDVRWSSDEDEVKKKKKKRKKEEQLSTKLYQHEATAACT